MSRKSLYGIIITLFVTVFLLAAAELTIAQASITVEPTSLRTDQGGTVSLYASTDLFSTTTTVRLVGYGIVGTHYVNPKALQATIPADLAAGTYTLEILDEMGDCIATGQITLVAPPPTPKPQSSPPPGRPILTVRNYWVDPPQVKPEQEFTVSIEVYNNGSRAGENTMAVFPGGAFLPLGDKGHLFWQVPINATFVATQRFRVPKETTNGVHDLGVQLSANDWEGNHYDYPATIPVEVVGASTGAAPTGKPKILVEGVSTSPTLIAPGAPFTLTLRLANRGSRTAVNVMASADAEAVVPAQGGNVASTDIIRIDETVTVTLPLLLKPGKEGGRQGLTIALEYSDYSGGGYSDHQTVGLDIDTSLANRPQVLIDAYHTDPESISPGDTFTLTLELTNVGGGNAQRLTLALGGQDGEQLGAFVPIGGSNVSFVPNVATGQRVVIALQLMVAGNAETKAHNLPVALAYDTDAGTREKDTQRVSLVVYRRPQFKVSFYRPVEGIAMVGQPFPLPIELANVGTARFNIPTLEATGAQLQFMGESSTFVGNLDPGGMWTLDTMAIASQAGPVDVVVNIQYVDDLNRTQVISQPLTIEVMEAPTDVGPGGPMGPNDMPQEPETVWQKALRFVKGFLGLGS